MIKSHTELETLLKEHPLNEDFGPATKHPFLIVEYADTVSSQFANRLKSLPCPVIGIGEGSREDVYDVLLSNQDHVSQIIHNIKRAPYAAMVLVQHLRAIQTQSVENALLAESFAYSTAQMGCDFKRWISTNTPQIRTHSNNSPLIAEVKNETLSITLNQPAARNAINVDMRDALCEALDLAVLDPSITRVTLKAIGPAFSTGGDITEFGSVTDPLTAHWIRTRRLPALRLAQLREKLYIHVNGAAIGAGIEMAAFAHHLTASRKAWFQLPELKYGLIPGAGGTVSIMNRIGRQKTTYMALSMKRVSAQTALKWGLIDAIGD